MTPKLVVRYGGDGWPPSVELKAIHVLRCLPNSFTAPVTPILAKTEKGTASTARTILARHGWAEGQPLSYRQLQALIGRWRDLVLVTEESVTEPGHAGGGDPTPDHDGQGGERKATGNGQRGHMPSRLWIPWPSPSKELVGLAKQALQAVQEELIDDARESIPTTWNYPRLAIRQELGQLG